MSDDADIGGAPEGVPIENAQVDVPAPIENQPPEATPEPVEEKKPSLRESIEKADAKLTESKPVEAKTEPKVEPKPEEPKPEAKADRQPDGKFAKKEQPEGDKSEAEKPAAVRGGDDARQSEGRKHSEPPARFLPEAREKWQNVPREVKDEIQRMEREGAERQQSAERYEPLRQYDELARSNGRDLRQSLEKVVQIETALAANPIAGLDMILREVGPRKADGSPMSLMDVARFVVQQTPEQMQQHMQPRQQQLSVEQIVETAVARMQQASERQSAEQHVGGVIERFAAANPDYPALEQQIASVLRSGVIEQIYGAGLPPEQKLAEAYRMVGGRKTTSHEDPATVSEDSQPATPRQANPAGQRSIAGARSPGPERVSGKRASPSLRAALERAVSRSGL